MGALVGRAKQVRAHLVGREVQDRQQAVLVQQLGVARIDDRLAAELRAHATREVLEVDQALELGKFSVPAPGGEWPNGPVPTVSAMRVLPRW